MEALWRRPLNEAYEAGAVEEFGAGTPPDAWVVPAQASFANFNAPPLSTSGAGKILLESNNSESYILSKRWHNTFVAARINELKCESTDRATVCIFLFLSVC